MKKNNFIKNTLIAALTLSAGWSFNSCTDNFAEINTDRYEVDPETLPFSAQFQEPLSYVYAPQ